MEEREPGCLTYARIEEGRVRCVNGDGCSCGGGEDWNVFFEAYLDVENFRGFKRSVRRSLGEFGEFIAPLFLEDLVDALKVLR